MAVVVWTCVAVMQFGALTPLEPRLGKKLIEPLTNLIHRYYSCGSHVTFDVLHNITSSTTLHLLLLLLLLLLQGGT